MTSQLLALRFHANRPARLARFWSGLLGWEAVEDPDDGITLLPADDTGFRIGFLPTEDRKVVQNRQHFDLTSTSAQGQRQTVARALELGGRHTDVGQRPEEGHVVLSDPEGNEFCVIPPGNAFLADCGFIGALACDGTQGVGYFWSRALGWPLVWDQDEETAIRSPHGGPKITWGGPPLMPKPGPNRLHFDLAPPEGADPRAEIDRLLSLGAALAAPAPAPGTDSAPDSAPATNPGAHAEPGTRAGGAGGTGWVEMTDPDGNEFRLRVPGAVRAGR